MGKIELIFRYLLLIVLFLSISCSQTNKIRVKKVRDREGFVTYYYYENNKLVKSMQTKNGIRDGVTESIHEDEDSYMRAYFIYEEGVLKEITWYSIDSIVFYKTIYYQGRVIEDWVIQSISEDTVKQLRIIYQSCNRCTQYLISNGIVVDSVVIKN